MNRYVTIGAAVLAGAALLETALIPGVVIGGAAVLAPKYLPRLRRQLEPLFGSPARPRARRAAPRSERQQAEAPTAPGATLGIKRAIAKTITFRIIVTTLDFTTNYVVIGELATAAGLSTFNLVVGPLFYLAHETAWNYFGPSGDAVNVSTVLRLRQDASPPADGEGVTISRALAKTITFRTIATVMDFTVNYVVVGDVVAAAGLSAFAFVVGPFVYLAHERAWDYYAPPGEGTRDASEPVKLLPAPA
jgi:uncharacterized membrane protein